MATAVNKSFSCIHKNRRLWYISSMLRGICFSLVFLFYLERLLTTMSLGYHVWPESVFDSKGDGTRLPLMNCMPDWLADFLEGKKRDDNEIRLRRVRSEMIAQFLAMLPIHMKIVFLCYNPQWIKCYFCRSRKKLTQYSTEMVETIKEHEFEKQHFCKGDFDWCYTKIVQSLIRYKKYSTFIDNYTLVLLRSWTHFSKSTEEICDAISTRGMYPKI